MYTIKLASLSTTASPQKKLRNINGAWWTAISIAQAFGLTGFALTNTQVITDSLISNLLLAGSCILIFNNMRYYLPRQEKYWYVLVISIIISSIWLFIVNLVLKMIFKNDDHYLLFLKQSLPVRFIFSLLMVGCMSMISLLWYTQEEQQEMETRKTEAERLTKEAELFKLRQQLQPHFLFNSLNSISALTGSQPEKARHMIQQLSDFLRGTLRRDEQQWSTLKEELEYLQLYLDIEKVRFGYRLQTTINCEEATLQMKLPSLLLQPVVENAIKFGLYDTVGEVMISISAVKKNELLEVKVENPFDAETAQPLQGTGFGLASIKRRLFLLFARHDLLETTSGNDLFITTITIPPLQ
ncbi:sensor histidine kinase [Panacibacter ginsenosidivorans]|uniref:Sensor histidine kinase n=1 Tax=Panacibacter ginsenosidivorans TaxID=1813871 RepID=A0A5B8VDB2_9BACT|nr:histidine kinase [Panacibacter ginsenosidivorans]QEC68983.1 sensor histidine kinase [Panacibacter ginsenosidivorans]